MIRKSGRRFSENDHAQNEMRMVIQTKIISATLDLDGMMEVLTALKAPLIIPMHFYGQYILDRFLDRARKLWDVETAEIPSVVVSKPTLPAATKVLVLPGQF
jgi:hypothetical protein